MLTRMRSHLSFANVVSLLALFVALGTGAYAAANINSADVVNNSLKNKDLKNNTVRGNKVNESSLTGIDDCPSGAATRAHDVCFGPIQSADDWDLAERDCASEGLRIPSLAEGLLVTDAATSPYLWTNDISDTDGTSDRVVVRTDDTGFTRIAVQIKTTPTAYRCVSTPVE